MQLERKAKGKERGKMAVGKSKMEGNGSAPPVNRVRACPPPPFLFSLYPLPSSLHILKGWLIIYKMVY